ncbi:MAG: cytochrome c3 family protein [Coriobacteriia bacterium]
MHLTVGIKRWHVMGVLVVAMCAVASCAYAYDEVNSSADCANCHGLDTTDPSGPHGDYSATSNKCVTCHSIHNALAEGVLLLPAATVYSTCVTCHDGTGGQGVYGAIVARTGVAPAAQHRMIDDGTVAITTIPGGSGTDGGDRLDVFSGTGGNLTCTDCHSPHGANVITEAFMGDRSRSTEDNTDPAVPVLTSTRLLKQRPTSMDPDAPAVTKYGSDWCAACHAGRLSALHLNNHPVEAAATYAGTDLAGAFTYQRIARLTAAGASTTTIGILGRSNFGYVMPDPRTPQQGDHLPICQQCHEDARSVGDEVLGTVSVSEEFTITKSDGLDDDPGLGGTGSTDNPRFQVFPHESDGAAFLVEQESSLCMNCHIKDPG